MFKVNIPINKATKMGNKLVIEGIASDPTIDRDYERFDRSAVSKMSSSVEKGNIPIRVEHQDKFFTNIGTWTKSEMQGDKMYVKGEVDLDMSLGRDLQVMLAKGADIALSVGGRVLDATREYAKDLNRNIKVYTDIILDEISVVKNPSNRSASLAIAKSYDVEKHEATAEGLKLESFSKSLQPAPSLDSEERLFSFLDRVEKGHKPEAPISQDEAFGKIENMIYSTANKLEKMGMPVEVEMEIENELSSEDLGMIVQITKIMKEVDIEQSDTPEALKDWEFTDSLPEESFVPMVNKFPHHNADFMLNEQWVKYWMGELCSGKYSYLCPKDFTKSLIHLFHHYKYLTMNKRQNPAGDTAKLEKSTTVVEQPAFSKEDMALMHACYAYKVNKEGDRPQVDGNDLSDKEVSKMAQAYSIMMQRKIQTRSIGARMAWSYRNGIPYEQSGAAEGQAVVDSKVNKEDEGQETADEDVEKEVAENVTPEAETTEKSTDAVENEVAEKEAEESADEATEEETEKGCGGKGGKRMKKEEEAEEGEEEVSKDEGDSSDEDSSEDITPDGADDSVDKTEEEAGDESSINKTDASEESTDSPEASEEDSEVSKAGETGDESAEATDGSSDDAEGTSEDSDSTEKSEDEAEASEEDKEVEKSEEDEVSESDDADTAEEETPQEETEKAQSETTKAIVEAVVKEVIENEISPLIEKLKESISEVEKAVAKSHEAMTKSAQAEQDRVSDVEQAVVKQAKMLVDQGKLLQEYGKRSSGRKSFATYSAIEKSYGFDEVSKEASLSFEDRVNKYMDENEGVSLQKAYATVKKSMQSEQ